MNHLIVNGGAAWGCHCVPLLPGAHVAVLSEDAGLDGLEGRKAGLEVRDALVVLSPGVTTRFILLFRKPTAEATVAEQVLKTGTGGINVDACRVNTQGERLSISKADPFHNLDGSQKWNPTSSGSIERDQHPAGRWPPNVLLVHGEGCKKVGVKKVKNVGGNTRCSQPGFGQDSGWNKHNNRATSITRNRDEDGLETVTNWNCQPDCPVRILDDQTGHLTSESWAHRPPVRKKAWSGFNGATERLHACLQEEHDLVQTLRSQQDRVRVIQRRRGSLGLTKAKLLLKLTQRKLTTVRRTIRKLKETKIPYYEQMLAVEVPTIWERMIRNELRP